MNLHSPIIFNQDDIQTHWLGLIDYDVALNLQYEIHQHVLTSGHKKMLILGLEHPSVITLGKRSNPQQDLNLQMSEFTKRNIKICQTDRGGFATLHNPGQLVMYPIFNLDQFHWSIKDYVSVLQGTIRQQIQDLGINCRCSVEDPGVFTDQGKIASVGLRIHQQTTMHGASVNISNDLREFAYLNPCGMRSRSMDKLSHYTNISTQEFFRSWVEIFISKIGNRSGTCD